MQTHFTVSDGELVLFLESAEEGGFVVSSPFDSSINTQAESLQEAFENAYDARELLRQTRTDLAREFAETGTLREAESHEAVASPPQPDRNEVSPIPDSPAKLPGGLPRRRIRPVPPDLDFPESS